MEAQSVGSPALWGGFILFVLLMLALDLGVFHRKTHEVKFKEALTWSGVWISLALVFNLGIWWKFGSTPAMQFLTGYLIEKSLSIDNIFVFVVIFSALKIPALYQHRVLFWGILSALVLRAAMIFAGVAMLAALPLAHLRLRRVPHPHGREALPAAQQGGAPGGRLGDADGAAGHPLHLALRRGSLLHAGERPAAGHAAAHGAGAGGADGRALRARLHPGHLRGDDGSRSSSSPRTSSPSWACARSSSCWRGWWRSSPT